MDSELKKLCKMDSTSYIIFHIEQIINPSRNIAYLYVNRALVLRNWLIGRRIDQEILKDQSFEDIVHSVDTIFFLPAMESLPLIDRICK